MFTTRAEIDLVCRRREVEELLLGEATRERSRSARSEGSFAAEVEQEKQELRDML